MNIDEMTTKAFQRYKEMLKNYPPKEYTKNFEAIGNREKLAHCHWMVDRMLSSETSHYSLDKRSRWLGFIQGVVIMCNLTTIEKERNITRPWFNKGE